MKLMAIGINYDECFTMSRQIEPVEDLTDEAVLLFMSDCNGGEPFDQVILITEDGEELRSDELVEY